VVWVVPQVCSALGEGCAVVQLCNAVVSQVCGAMGQWCSAVQCCAVVLQGISAVHKCPKCLATLAHGLSGCCWWPPHHLTHCTQLCRGGLHMCKLHWASAVLLLSSIDHVIPHVLANTLTTWTRPDDLCTRPEDSVCHTRAPQHQCDHYCSS
jgi:hypothetical protein